MPILFWTVCLFFSFVGWGKLVVSKAGWALAGVAGAALLTAIAGILNLLRWVHPIPLISITAAGDGLAILFAMRSSKRNRKWLPVSALLTIAVAVPAVGNLRSDVRSFSVYDDLPAYLSLPAETLQLGALPFDPFNERRVTSCLGAAYVLQDFALIASDVRSLHVVDVSLGTILYAGILVAIYRRLGLSPGLSYLLPLLIFLVPVFRLNATFVVLPAAMFCALFLVAWETGSPIVLALIASALCAIKSNYLPPAVLMCGFFFVFKRRYIQCAVWACFTLLLLAPWMIDMHAKEGTYLFPLLGRGYDASAYGSIPMPNGSHGVGSAAKWVWLTVLPMAGPLAIALAMAFFYLRKKTDSVALMSLLLAASIAISAIASSTGGESIGRYSLPFQIPALLVFLGFVLRWNVRPAIAFAAIVLACLGLVFGVHHDQYRTYLEDAHLLTPKPESWFDMRTEEKRQRLLQSSIPAGERLLARIFVSYALDFQRNRIFLPDYTGMAGFRPGMPIDGDLGRLTAYLRANRIHYVAFDPRTMRPDDDPATGVEQTLKNPARYGRHGWLYMQVKIANFEQMQLARLAKLCPRTYGDGSTYVLNLDGCQLPPPVTMKGS